MKYIISLFVLMTAGLVYAKSVQLPVDVTYQINEDSVQVNMSFQKDIKKFSIANVKGTDGMKVANFNKAAPKDVRKLSTEIHEFIYTKSPGLSYMVLELKGTVDGIPRTQMVSIPLGKQSQEQVTSSEENILEVGDKKIHAMRLEQKPIKKIKQE